MVARNLSSASNSGTKGEVATGLALRKLKVRPLDLKVLEKTLLHAGVPKAMTW